MTDEGRQLMPKDPFEVADAAWLAYTEAAERSPASREQAKAQAEQDLRAARLYAEVQVLRRSLVLGIA